MAKIKPLFFLIIALFLLSCRFLTLTIADLIKDPEPTPEYAPTEEATVVESQDDAVVNPLTGQPASDPALLDRRPVMIKVANWPRGGRPHSGLTQADIVFEYYIGFEMNRFLAVYYSEDCQKVGPLRSGRLVDAQLTTLYQGLLAYGNADPKVEVVLQEVVGERALAWKRMPCPPVCGTTRDTVSGMFVDSGGVTEHAVSKGVDNTPPDLQSMSFNPVPPEGDGDGSMLRLEYAIDSIMEWHFDRPSGRYHLWTDFRYKQPVTSPMTDRNNGAEIAFENVMVMFAEYVEYAPLLHDIIIQDVQDPQPAFLFRDGVMINATWRVDQEDRPIVFETWDGDPMQFKPGRTWFVIVGLNSQMTETEAGSWWIGFDLP